jgi:phosphoglycolate phosphatase-like HAD superfamily hydrolase
VVKSWCDLIHDHLMLLLFDIDGTLMLKASRAHAEALHAALRRVHDLSDIPSGKVDAAGRTDDAIARQILTLAGVSAERIDARAHEVRALACAEYRARCPDDLAEHVAPGAVELLEALAARDDVTLSLVTGNLECVARRKLAAGGLGRFFPAGQGGFGSDSEDRTDLPEIARNRAGGIAPEQTVVIGDTPRDIACARADGVHCVAISTGPFRATDLHGADVVIDMLRELPVALTRIPGLA